MNELSGYGEFELAGRLLPFKFGANATALLCKHRGIELDQFTDLNLFGVYDNEQLVKSPDLIANVELAYFAYVTAKRIKGEQPDINIELFTEMFHETEGIIFKFQDLMVHSKMLGFSLVDLGGMAKKK